jgi:hypothetical protein
MDMDLAIAEGMVTTNPLEIQEARGLDGLRGSSHLDKQTQKKIFYLWAI